MAYVLGFTFADGNIHKTSLSWDLQLKDKEVLVKIKRALSATYRITLQRRSSYRLRINNRILINGAIKKGLLPKKNIRNILPNIPTEYLNHFVRGYLDGDGWTVLRKGRNEFDLGFSSGNKEFLNNLSTLIAKNVGVKYVDIRKRLKMTPKKLLSTTYMMEYYSVNAIRVADWIFSDLQEGDLYLNRKYKTYLRAKKIYDYLESGTRITRVIQKKLKQPISDILKELSENQKLDGVKVAKILGVHSSSVYRWLEKFGIKYPHHKMIYG
jgi:intein-encoded DNA endonuclease-like protein